MRPFLKLKTKITEKYHQLPSIQQSIDRQAQITLLETFFIFLTTLITYYFQLKFS